MPWTVVATTEVIQWLDDLAANDPNSSEQVTAAIEILGREGPTLGRPIVDTIKGSSLANLKELRPGSSGKTELRILWIFDPVRQAVLLVAGNKAGNWTRWYTTAIREAETRYEEHLAALAKTVPPALPRQKKRRR